MYYLFSLLLTKLGREILLIWRFGRMHQTCLCAFFYCAQCIFFLQARPKRISVGIFWRIAFFLSQDLLKVAFSLRRLLNFLSAVGDCAEWRWDRLTKVQGIEISEIGIFNYLRSEFGPHNLMTQGKIFGRKLYINKHLDWSKS